MVTRGPDIRVYLAGDATAFLQMLTRANRSLDAFKIAVGGASVYVGAQLGQTLVDATAQAVSFESAFTGVEKTLADADFNPPTLALLDAQLKELSQTIPVTYEELARIGELGGQLGVRARSIDEFTDTIAKLGVTTVLSVDQAAIQMARFVNIIEGADAEPEAFERIGSVLVELGNNAAVLEDELLEFSFRIGQVGSIVGLSADEILAFSARLGEMGVNVESGGNAVSRVFLEMQDAVLSGSDELDVFARTAGVSVGEFASLFREDASQALFLFVQGLEGIITGGGNVSEVLESVGFNTIRIRQALLSLARDTPRLDELLGLAAGEAGSPDALQEEAARRFDDTREQIQGVRNELALLGATVGDDVLPALNLLLGALDSTIGAMSAGADAAGPVPALLLATSSAAAIVGGAYTILNGVLAITRARMIELGVASRAASAAMFAMPIALGVVAGLAVGGAIRRLTDDTEDLTGRLEAATAAGRELQEALSVTNPQGGLDPSAIDQYVAAYDRWNASVQALRDAEFDLYAAQQSVDQLSTTSERREQYAAVAEAKRTVDELTASELELSYALGFVNDLTLGQLLLLRDEIRETYGSNEAVQALTQRIWELTDARDAAEAASAAEREWLQSLGIEAEETEAKIVSLSEAIERLAGEEVDSERATLRFFDSLDRLGDQLLSNSEGLSLLTEGGRANRDALLTAAESAVSAGAAYAEMTGSLEDGREMTAFLISSLLDTATSFGISRQEALNYLAQLNLLPDDVLTRVTLNEGEALDAVQNIRSAIFRLPTRYRVVVDIALAGTAGSVTGAVESTAEQARQGIQRIVDLINRVASGATGGASGGGGGGGGGGSTVDAFAEALKRLDLLYEVGEIDRADYLAALNQLLTEEERLSDNWVDVWRRRERVLNDIAKEEADALKEQEKAAEEAQKAIDKVLEEADRALRDYEQSVTETVDRLTSQLSDAVTETADLLSEFGQAPDVDEDELVAFLEHRLEATERWMSAVEQLRRNGTLPDSLVNQLALAGPESLGLAEALTRSSGIGALLGQFDQLAGRNVDLGLGGLLPGALDPLGFTLGQPSLGLGGSTVTIGAPTLTVQIDADTLYGDIDTIRQIVADQVQPAIDDFTDQILEAAEGGSR